MATVYQINFLLLLVGVLLFMCNQVVADSHSQVKFLPGFEGPLPFHLQTGYVGVDESEDVQLFYYFFESERNPKQDPLILWMSGGPGCSSFTAVASGIGPLYFKEEKTYNGTLPTLFSNPNTWTKIASMIFLDLPVGTGFSYGKTSIASSSNDIQACAQAVQFLRKSLRRSCGLDHQKSDSDSAECSQSLETYDQCTSGLNQYHILEKNCNQVTPQLCRALSDEKRAAIDRFGESLECPVNALWLFGYWFNDESFQEALHIRKGTIGTWVRCNRDNLPYEILVSDVIPYHANLSTKGYKSLIYSGDHDFVVPFQSTQAWIRNLNYSIIDDWRPWIVDGQYAGYTRAYSNKMTFATVKGGGHTAQQYKPAECYVMFERWIWDRPL